MANIKSQKKRVITNAKRTERNKAVKSEVRTRVKAARETKGTPENAEALRMAVKRLDMAAAKRIIHPKQAARKKSRLMRALNAAKHARVLGVPLWAVPAPPWHAHACAGSVQLIELGHARALWRVEDLLGAPAPRVETESMPAQLPIDALAVMGALGPKPAHLDEIVEKSGLTTPETTVRLLTLAGLGVVLEGPPGWFRRLR
ncbi:MAG: 30S ribosomal protein S20 [Actinobacteria bacterium]|nr:30S ribosomal protein S20 [Actinomycetota bacterium]